MKYIKTYEKYQPIITGNPNNISLFKTYIGNITPDIKKILDNSKFKLGDNVKLIDTDAALFLIGGLDVNVNDNDDNVSLTSDIEKYKKRKDNLIFIIDEIQIYTRGKKTDFSYMLKMLNEENYIGWVEEKYLIKLSDAEISANKYNI